ncbi:MAG TPA: prenyltransferase/squalene oxidase repeat-containing protein [Pirellulaceae bacterium]|nr:prenyltransferase/squalene oxidase repeat-containing protein [Pirellulaceae bacterium]
MAKLRRVIRKTKQPTEAAFDDQFWPVMLALFVLGGFLVGTVLAYLRFDEGRWYANAWTWLFVIPIFLCSMIWLLRKVESRAVRRGVQFSAVLCIIVHLVLFIVSLEINIFGRMWAEFTQLADARVEREPLVEPIYDPVQFESQPDQPQDLLRPVETETPETELEQLEQEQQEPEPPTERQPTPTPEPEITVKPNEIQRPTPAETVPRQAEQMSQLSRQAAKTPPQPNQRVEQPQPASQQTPQPSAIASQDAQIQRQATETQATRAMTAPDVPVQAEQPRIERARPTEQATEQIATASVPTMPRSIAEPQAVPRTQVDSNVQPSVAQQTQPQEVAPSNTTARQQTTASPQVDRVATQPTPSTVADVQATSQRREQQAAPDPNLAQSPTPVSNQRARATSRPDLATMAVELAPSSAPSAQANPTVEATSSAVARTQPTSRAQSQVNLAEPTTPAPTVTRSTRSPSTSSPTATSQPNDSQVARRSTSQSIPSVAMPASNVPQATAGSASGSASSGSASAVAASSSSVSRQAASGASTAGATPVSGGPQLAPATQIVASSRAAASDAPTINSAVAASNSPARSSRTAELAASPANIDSPATAQPNSGESAPTPEATRTAMTRSLQGVSGVGQAANLDRALDAADSPSLVASGSARRAEATQNSPAGAALAPSAPALVRHSLAGAERPSASLLATTTGPATVAGSQQPADLTASSSGALTRANANAAPGAVTADAGQVQVDLGPTRVVSGGGASRAAGGGQPEMNPSAQAQQLARNSSGGTPQPTLASSTVAAETAAPAGTGGGQPTPQGIAPTLANVGRGEPSQTEIGSGATPASPSEPADAPAASAALAGGTPTRADGGPRLPEVATATGAAGGEVNEDEEERARRLARQALGGAPPVAVRAELPSELAARSGGPPTQVEPTSDAEAADGQLARAEASGGAPSTGGAASPTENVPTAGGGGELTAAVVVRRAEATDGVTGAPEPGGGTSSPSKASPSRSFTANAVARLTTVAGTPNSSGSPSGSPVDTPGIRAAELTGGRSGATVGAEADRQMLDGVADSRALAGVARQARSASASDGPAVGNESSSAAPVRRTAVGPVGLSSSAAETIDVPTAPSSTALARADTGDAGLQSGLGPMSRQSSASIPVEIDALDGSGGLGDRPAADVGLNSRRARADSLQIQSRATRFVRQEVGGTPNVNTAAVVAADAFRGRSKPGDSPGSMGSSAGQQSDKAIELGLAYLARQQLADGSWNLQAVDHSAQLVSDTAATGLALLAFQGYGYTHRDNKYAAVVKRAIDYLVQHQQENGDLFIPLDDESNRSVWLYSHGIAALAMCEAYGMTQDPELKGPAQKALDFIVSSQHKEYGGWRYAPNFESDTSVTGWMMMALKSGDLANLEVPTETYALIERWLDVAQGSRSERHKYRYNPYAPDTASQAHGRDASETMTAVGLLMRFYTGWNRDNENMARGADFMLKSPPAIGTARDPKRDTYYWYYATQVMFHMGGEYWRKWNDQLRPVLLDAQIQTGPDAGSWNPRFPVADRWAPHAGRLYVTTLNLLSLEVHYRHLPLYDETGR